MKFDFLSPENESNLDEDMWDHGNNLDVRFVDLQLMRYGERYFCATEFSFRSMLNPSKEA